MPESTSHPVLFSPPSVGASEADRVARVLASGWLTTGPETAEFESRFREYVGADSALAVNSCTSALSLALRTLDIGPGDEVITTTNTFVSTVNVIEHAGATPVLVDIEADTMNLCPALVAEHVNSRTKAVIAVHFAGHPVRLAELQALCTEHRVPLIEDAAHAVAAKTGETMIGGSGNLTAFSFYATKNLTTGEGGMLTGPQELIDRARTLSLHGMSRNAWNRYGDRGRWHYDVEAAGFKCNMSDPQAAIGIAQLERLPELQARREAIWRRYDAAFEAIDAYETPTVHGRVVHARHLYILRLRGVLFDRRDELFDTLYEAGIRPSLHFIPIHRHSYYRDKYGDQTERFPVAESCYSRMLSLPLSPALTDDQIDRVIDAVCRFATTLCAEAA